MNSLFQIFADACEATGGKLVGSQCLPHTEADPETMQTLFNIAYVIIGALAFLMLVVSAIRYVAAQGQPEKIAEIKKQILYVFAGLIVVALAAALVNFVLSSA